MHPTQASDAARADPPDQRRQPGRGRQGGRGDRSRPAAAERRHRRDRATDTGAPEGTTPADTARSTEGSGEASQDGTSTDPPSTPPMSLTPDRRLRKPGALDDQAGSDGFAIRVPDTEPRLYVAFGCAATIAALL